MKSVSPIDRYVAAAEPFAKPILETLRFRVHEACKDCEEVMKWSFPNFMYKGKILCHMAAFKQHCTFGFWLAGKMKDPEGILESGKNKNAMGQLGKITSLKDLPTAKVLKAYIREAMVLIDAGETLERKPTGAVKLPEIPPDLEFELKKNKKAAAFYNTMPPSHKKEYLQWILEAKRDETRLKRVRQAIDMLSEGKGRNWKYETKK